MSAFSTMDDASLAATISAMRDGIAVGNAPLRDSLMPAIRARLRRRELAQNFLDGSFMASPFGAASWAAGTTRPPGGPVAAEDLPARTPLTTARGCRW